MTSTMDLPTQRDTDDLDTTGTPEAVAEEAVVAVPDVEADATEHPNGDEVVSGEDAPDELSDTPLDELSDEDRAALHARWDAEINTVQHVDPHEVLIAENVRTEHATPDDATTANFKTHGINTATNGYRDYDTGAIVVTEGQRRVLNAREAGCELPVWMKTPPPADERKATIERIVTQIIENDMREPLTLGDTARGLQQLAAFNLTPGGIARKLARGKNGKAYVENMLQAGRSELAVKATERFDLDLVQAAVIAEFDEAGDLESAKELIRIAREAPNNFQVVAERKRAERAENERFAALTDALTHELTTAGVTIFDNSLSDSSGDSRSLDRLRPTPEDEPHAELTAEDHASCPGHGAWIDDEYDEDDKRIPVAVYGCADFRAHGHALSHAPAGRADLNPLVGTSTSADGSVEAIDLDGTASDDHDEVAAARAALAAEERAREAARIIRRWVIKNNKDWDASEAPRREWLTGFALRKTAPQGSQLFLALQKAHGGYALRRAFERNHSLARDLLGMPVGSTVANLSNTISTASSPGKATLYDVFLTLCAMEADLTRNAWRSSWGSAKEYFAAITSWGYKASDVELMVLNPQSEQEVVAAQLDGGDGSLVDQPVEDSETEHADNDREHGGESADVAADQTDADTPLSTEESNVEEAVVVAADSAAEDQEAAEPDAVHAEPTGAAI